MKIPPPVVLLVAAILIYGAAQYFPSAGFRLPGGWWTAGAIMAFGLSIDLLSVLTFRRSRTTVNPIHVEQASSLVTSGPFRFSRNPMYLGMAILLTGFGLGMGTWGTPAVLGLFIWWITTQQIAREEPAMEALFGDAFRTYKTRVRRWI